MGRTWFPCYDSPCDKATADFHVKTPLARTGVANGVLVSVDVDSVASVKTWNWTETHQIATYLMAVAIARYDAIPDPTYPWITHYVHNTISSLAPATFANVDDMMTAFIDLFGPYPWDRFGYVTTNVGDMEHQTCVFHAYGLVNGGTSNDDIVAHEMGHQWWGDLVTYADWREIYLSEGFATYCEALFREQFYGVANFRAYVTSALFGAYLGMAAAHPYPLYDPINKWGVVSYEKGASVLHMLRGVMGDANFFAGLAAYRAAHEEDVATTEDLRAAMESVHGSSLDWFFQEWVYSGGHPKYDWWWWTQPAGTAHEVRIRLTQTQTVGPIFAMPIEFRITTAAGDTTVVGFVDQATETLVFVLDDPATNVVFDPDDWVLEQHTLNATSVEGAGGSESGASAPAGRVALHPASPNPARGATTIAFHLPEPRPVTIEIYGVGGRVVRTLARDAAFAAGDHRLVWDGRDQGGARVASGVYVYRLVAGDAITSRRVTIVR
jgi:aminopeptidase N